MIDQRWISKWKKIEGLFENFIKCQDEDYSISISIPPSLLTNNLDALNQSFIVHSEDDFQNLGYLYHQIEYILERKQNYINALSYYKQTLDMELRYLPSDHPSLSAIYNNIGGV
ncbi:hypothetical protein I4U23_025452 [Adineta vaga]|nr:hypothetical protein I4U23_025452 [Adineta vaga]